MKPSNYQQSIFSLFRYAIVAILIFSFILITSVRSYAEDPSAVIVLPFGNNIVVREGTYRNPIPWKSDGNGHLLGELRRFRDTLEIPGDKKSKANLNFISETTVVKDHGRLMISTVPSSDNTEYLFPCGLTKGSLTIGWRKVGESRERACNEGISVGPSVGKQSYRPNLNYRDGLQASKKILLAQSFSDVIIVPPDSGSRFLQAVANENGAEIITLQGDILVKSGKHLQGRLIPEGNQYSYPQDTITPIDKNSIINSPAVQDFLNPNNWLSPDISQRVADGITGQLGEMQTALGKGAPAVASNSGNNNNNSGQSPLNQSPQRTASQSTEPQPSQPGVNLNGEWTFNFGYFIANSDGSCEVAPEAGSYQGQITITQNGSQLNISAPGAVPMTNGTVSSNQFESKGFSPMRWVGTISSDGNKISGSGICGSVNMPFTMTRQGSQASSPTSSPGGNPPVITSFTCNGNNSSCTVAWKVPASLSISYTDEDGDASSWTVSGYTVGKSTAEGQILPANGRSGSIDTSVVCTCEGNNCSSSRTFQMRAVVIDATGLQGTASLSLQCQPSVTDRIQDIIRDRIPIPRLPF